MKAWNSGARTSSVVALAVAAAAGFANVAAAQETQKPAQKLFIEGDIVRGNTPSGLTGPLCVLANQFKRKEKVYCRPPYNYLKY